MSKSYGARLAFEITLLLLALIWFVTPYLVCGYINRTLVNLPEYTGRVERVGLNPLTASVTIYNFHMDKKTGEIPVSFIFCPKICTSLQWSQIIHGTARASIILNDPQINLVAGPTSTQSQLSISMIWINTLKQLVPWRINQIRIHSGDLHFRDFHADPPVDLEVNQIEMSAENISNSQKLKVPLPTSVQISAHPLITGFLEMKIAINFDEKYATFTKSFRMEHVPAVAANSALKKYLKVEAQRGEIGLYSEVTCDKGIYQGYVKPFFSKIEFKPRPEDKDVLGSVWSGVLNTVKNLVENNHDVIATQTAISGRVDQPNIDTIGAIIGVLWNAYVESLKPGFDPTHSPPPPTDTVTIPQSPITEHEAEQLPVKSK